MNSKKNKTSYLKKQNLKNKTCCRNILEKIRSRFILKRIFDDLKENKFLETIGYNKEIRNKLDISINDYKEYLQIEIEMIRILNKDTNFIYILNKNNKCFYHIYLDNNKKETKREYITEKDNAKKIMVKIDYEIKSLTELFKDREYIEKINFIKCNRNDIVGMNSIFF